MAINCVGIFCEDIREEVGGVFTIVGVMPDNISLQGGGPRPPGTGLLFPKLGVYVRVNLDQSYQGGAISCRVLIPGMPEITLGTLDADFIQKVMKDSAARKFPTAGFLFKLIVSPLKIEEGGLAQIVVTAAEKDVVCGALNIQVEKVATSSTAPQPHS